MAIDVKDFGVFSFDITNTDYEVLLHEFARKMKGRVSNHHFELPPEFGMGNVHFLKLPNGLHAALFDFIWQKDWIIHRGINEEEFYTLRFEELTVPGRMELTIDEQKIVEHKMGSSAGMVGFLSAMFSPTPFEPSNGKLALLTTL